MLRGNSENSDCSFKKKVYKSKLRARLIASKINIIIGGGFAEMRLARVIVTGWVVHD